SSRARGRLNRPDHHMIPKGAADATSISTRRYTPRRSGSMAIFTGSALLRARLFELTVPASGPGVRLGGGPGVRLGGGPGVGPGVGPVVPVGSGVGEQKL
ncbi:MAG: hypothetical protein ACYCUF_12510, partial [Acidimicrobiales bacterium]